MRNQKTKRNKIIIRLIYAFLILSISMVLAKEFICRFWGVLC